MISPRQERWLLWLLAGLQFSHILDFMLMMPLAPQLMRLWQLDSEQFSWLVSAYSFSAFVAALAAFFWIDRLDRKQSLLILGTGFGIATLFCGLAPDFWTLLAARVLAGAFGGILGALIYAVIGDLIPLARRGQATGLILSAFSVAAVVGVPAGMFLANHLNWRAPFVLLALWVLPLLILSFRLMPSIRLHLKTPQQPAAQRLLSILSRKRCLLALALISALMLAGFSVIPFISPYMVHNVGATEADIGWFYLAGGLAAFSTARLIGRLCDRFGSRTLFVWVALASLVPILLLTQLPSVSLWQAIPVFMLFMTLVSGRMIPAMTLITSSIDSALRGSFMSLNSAVQQLSSGLASLLAGGILSIAPDGRLLHYHWVGYFACLMTLVSVVLAWQLNREPAY